MMVRSLKEIREGRQRENRRNPGIFMINYAFF